MPEEIQWLWALWKPEWQYLWNGAILECPNHPATQPQAGVFGPQDSVKDPSEGSEGLDLLHFDVKIASANVLTLLPKRGPAGVQGRARMEMLQKQFAQEGYHLIGVQEARVRTEIKIEQDGFLVFSAPASAAGHYGCQLWISTTLPFGPPGTCVKSQHCKLVAKDPRFLIIQIKAPFLRAIVISAHAPTSQASQDTISKWWHTLGQAIPTRLRQWPQILLVDANARVGSHPSLAVGPYQGDEQDGGGDELHGYLIANQLWLPATFEEQHEGEAGTWKHPKTEEWSRGDFIGLPRAWTFSRCRSFIETNVDLSLSREDHRPPAVHLQWSALPFTSGPNRPRRTTYDVQSLKQDLTGTNYCGTIGSLRASLGTMPWSVDVHTHTATLQHCLRHWMATWYGKRRKQPRRPNMSEETWTLVLAKQEARKILFNNNLRQKRWHLQLCFGAWARGEIAAGETFAEACHQATTLQKFRLLGRQVTAALRRDDRKFFTDLANQIGANDTPGQCNQLWQKIRWMLPKAKSRRGVSPLLIESLDNQWMPHFAKLEAGTTTTAADLVNRCAARQAEGDAAVLPKLVDLPTRFEVEQILLRQQCNKAAGPDGLPSDLYRYAASTIAAPLHDIICKTVCWNMEAVQNKGGVMFPLHKKGPQEVAANYRGVMLLNIASKILHSWVRTRMMSHLETIRPDTQIGGFKHQQVTYGAHCIQLVAKLAHHHQVPMSCIFLDVQGAYHFLIRDLVMGPSPPVDVERILQNLQEWEIDRRGVQLWMKLPCILERLRFPSALMRLLREIHLDTWAQLPHLDEVLRTTKGSRPGSPLADAVYAALMLDIHVEVDRILAESEVVTAGFKTLQIDGFAVTWADDLAIPVVTNTNEELIPAVLWVAQRVHAAFERRGLLLNMQRGKTTAVLAFRGKEGPRYRKEHLLTPNPGADLHLSQGRTLRLHFCSAYRHLGAVFIPDGEVTTEVASRLGQAKTAYHSLKKNLFGNRKLSPRTRLKLFEALIVSKLCFGVCTWGHLQRRSWQSIETFVTRAQRYIYNGEIGGVTTSEITSRYQLPSLQQRISSARLKYAVRLFTNGPTTLATLLAAEDEVSQTSWWKHVEEDLRWCGSLLGPDLPVQADDREALVKSWKLHSTLWWRTFRKAFKISLLQEATAADVRYWHGQIVRVLIDGGESIDHLYNHGKQEQCYHCPCGRSFDTIQGLTAHRRYKHGYIAPETTMVGTAVSCPHCLKHLWTPARVKQHLSYIPRGGGGNPCYNALLKAGYAVDLEVPSEPPRGVGETRGINRRDALQAAGPRLQPKDALQEAYDAARHEEEDFTTCFDEGYDVRKIDLALVEKYSRAYTAATQQWFHEIDPEMDHLQAMTLLQDKWLEIVEMDDPEDAVTLITIYWGREILQGVTQGWEAGFAEQWAEQAFYDLLIPSNYFRDEEQLHRLQGKTRQLAKLLQEREHLPDQAHREVRHGPAFHRGSRRCVQQIRQRYLDGDGWHEGWKEATLRDEVGDVPFPFYKEVLGKPIYLVLHLFSGRRRATDFHAYLQEMVANNQDFGVHILSLDTAVHTDYGNLSWTSTTWKQLMKLLRSGQVAAALAGPPCETWSAARHHQPEPEPDQPLKKWPRPLRDEARPWGLPGLQPKELRQLLVGSQFGLQVILVLAFMVVSGGLFLGEHPSPAPELWKASIFRTPVIRLLLQHSMVQLRNFQQGDWGARSNKPTSLLTARLQGLAVSMLRWRRPTPMSERTTSIGRDASGVFRTAQLKEYPPMFAKGMAQGIYDGLKKKHRDRQGQLHFVDEELSTWVQIAQQISEVIDTGTDFLPDYQPDRAGD